jgi:hypothetical protein
MPQMVRCDDQELICRKQPGYREWGIAVAAYGLWLLLSAHWKEFPVPPFSSPTPANPLSDLFDCAVVLIGLFMIFPAELRIDFPARRYRLVTEIDWLRLRPSGHSGSCDEIDHVEIEYHPERGGRYPWGWVSLVWKDPGRPAFLVTAAALHIEPDAEVGFRFHPHRYGVPERIAVRLGVRLEVFGVVVDEASAENASEQEVVDQAHR